MRSAWTVVVALGCTRPPPTCSDPPPGTRHVPDDHTTIQAAIDAAADGGLVCVSDGTYTEQLTLTDRRLIIEGVGPDAVVVDAEEAGSVVQIEGGYIVLSGLTLTGGLTSNDGGGIVASDTVLRLDGMRLHANQVVRFHDYGHGGGLYATNSRVFIHNATVSDNRIEAGVGRGAGLAFEDSDVWLDQVHITGSVVRANGYSGAGLWQAGGTLQTRGLTVSHTDGQKSVDGAIASGLGLDLLDVDASLEDTLLEDNLGWCEGATVACSLGSGILEQRFGTLQSTHLTIHNNHLELNALGGASGGPGVALSSLEQATLTHTLITNNRVDTTTPHSTSVDAHGLLHLYNVGHTRVSHFTATHNTTGPNTGLGTTIGGAIFARCSPLQATHVEVRGNHAGPGSVHGGLIQVEGSAAALENVVLAGNTFDDGYGLVGGVAGVAAADCTDAPDNTPGHLSLRQADIVGNVLPAASVRGGLFRLDAGSTITLENTQLVDNVVPASEYPTGRLAHFDDTPGSALRLRHASIWPARPGPHAWWPTPPVSRTLSLPPAYTDTTSPDPVDWNLHLKPHAAAIDAGAPGTLDADGSPADLGAYGGPNGATW